MPLSRKTFSAVKVVAEERRTESTYSIERYESYTTSYKTVEAETPML